MQNLFSPSVRATNLSMTNNTVHTTSHSNTLTPICLWGSLLIIPPPPSSTQRRVETHTWKFRSYGCWTMWTLIIPFNNAFYCRYRNSCLCIQSPWLHILYKGTSVEWNLYCKLSAFDFSENLQYQVNCYKYVCLLLSVSVWFCSYCPRFGIRN